VTRDEARRLRVGDVLVLTDDVGALRSYHLPARYAGQAGVVTERSPDQLRVRFADSRHAWFVRWDLAEPDEPEDAPL
jgi:hypothetical protein